MADKNIRVSGSTHEAATKYVQEKGMLLGKFADNAIKEKIHREITQGNPVVERNIDKKDFG